MWGTMDSLNVAVATGIVLRAMTVEEDRRGAAEASKRGRAASEQLPWLQAKSISLTGHGRESKKKEEKAASQIRRVEAGVGSGDQILAATGLLDGIGCLECPNYEYDADEGG